MDSIEDTYEEELTGTRFKSKKKTRDDLFIRELNELPYPLEIRTEAFNVYKSMIKIIKRKKNRTALKFFCVYNAFRNLNKIQDPNQLAKTFNVNPSEISKVFKMFSFENTGYRMKNVEISPLDYIRDYYAATDFRIDEVIGVVDFAKVILSKDSFDEEYPQDVAAAIICYYLSKLYNVIPSKKFIEFVGRSETNVNKLVDKIGSIYNS